MIPVPELLVHGFEFFAAFLTFFCAYAIVKWFSERQQLKVMQRKKLDDHPEPVVSIASQPEKSHHTRDCSTGFVPFRFNSSSTQALRSELSELDKPVAQKEPKGKKDKSKKSTTTPGNDLVPKEKTPAQQVAEQDPQFQQEVADSEQVQAEAQFQEVMPNKKAKKEARLRSKAQETEEKVAPKEINVTPVAKQKPHCPPPSHPPVMPTKGAPHCPPPALPPVMPTKAAIADLDNTVQNPVVEVQKTSPQPLPVPSQNQMSPLDKEILNLEKKFREIEKLQAMKAEGGVLEKMQEKKIERAGEIGLKLSQLYAAKMAEAQIREGLGLPVGQMNMTVGNFGASQEQVFDARPMTREPPGLGQEVTEVQKKKRVRKTKSASESLPKSHTPVVVPPRVQTAQLETQMATELLIAHTQMTQAEMWGLPEVEEDCEDFEMTPLDSHPPHLDAPDFWGSNTPTHFQPQNLAEQFDHWSPETVPGDNQVPNEWPSESENLVCEPIVGKSMHKDDCWEWIHTGECPRGSHCRWNHRPLGNGLGAAETSVFALNLQCDSDSD